MKKCKNEGAKAMKEIKKHEAKDKKMYAKVDKLEKSSKKGKK